MVISRRLSIVRRLLAVAVLVLAAAVPAGAVPAGGSPRGELIASFTEDEDAHVITPKATGGNVTILSVTSAHPEILQGRLSGPFTEEFRVLVFPDGAALASGTFTCECTYAGRSGTVEIHIVEQIAPGFESAEGRWVAVGRSGGLRGLRGSGTLSEEHGQGELFGRLQLT